MFIHFGTVSINVHSICIPIETLEDLPRSPLKHPHHTAWTFDKPFWFSTRSFWHPWCPRLLCITMPRHATTKKILPTTTTWYAHWSCCKNRTQCKKDYKVLGEELTCSNSVSCSTGQMFHLHDAAGSSQMLGGQLAAGQSEESSWRAFDRWKHHVNQSGAVAAGNMLQLLNGDPGQAVASHRPLETSCCFCSMAILYGS